MGEDEAFIRAIVDNPGDDLPRLVYADWLDDRADPRGPYLRAEREAVETGDVARLRELAAGLDPVWVARVSRPPVGVCVGSVITDCGPQLTTGDTEAAQQRLGAELSAEYLAFLLNYNGGQLHTGSGPGVRFYPFVRKPKQGTFADLVSVFRQYRSDCLGRDYSVHLSPWHRNYVPVAGIRNSSDVLCLGITSETRGRLYVILHDPTYDPSNVHLMAKSLAEFLNRHVRA
jgi:uncharacterized protein (TIGR02996 family)